MRNPTASTAADDLTLDELRDELLGDVSPEEFHALGAEYQTSDILDSYRDFVKSARGIWASLSTAQRGHFFGFDPIMLDLVDPEAAALREKKSVVDAASAAQGMDLEGARAEEKSFRITGIALRDQGARVLRRVHAGKQHEKVLSRVAAAVGTAESNDDLANGIDTVAGIVTATHKAAKDKRLAMLTRLGVTPAHAAKMSAHAAKLREAARTTAALSTDPRVAQRALDIQDGRVLWVIRFAHEAFRSARAFDGTILLPDLGKLSRLYEAGRGASAKAAPSPPVA